MRSIVPFAQSCQRLRNEIEVSRDQLKLDAGTAVKNQYIHYLSSYDFSLARA